MPAPAATIMTTSSTANIPRLLARGSLTEGDVAAYSVASTHSPSSLARAEWGPFPRPTFYSLTRRRPRCPPRPTSLYYSKTLIVSYHRLVTSHHISHPHLIAILGFTHHASPNPSLPDFQCLGSGVAFGSVLLEGLAIGFVLVFLRRLRRC